MKFVLNNPLAHAFFDDMVDVGAFTWAKYAFVCALLSYGLDGVVPFAFIIGVVLSLNLLAATAVTLWWDHYGRRKYATGTIMDIAQRAKGRDKND